VIDATDCEAHSESPARLLPPARHRIAQSPGLLPLPVLREDDFQTVYFEDNKLRRQNTADRRQKEKKTQTMF